MDAWVASGELTAPVPTKSRTPLVKNAYGFLHLFQRRGRVQSKPALDLVTMID
jgi:hypothetical protein